MSQRRLFRILLPLVLVGAMAPSSVQAQRSEARVKDDIAFARGLAARFRYIDLAEGLISGLEAEGVKGELAEELGLVKCDVYYEGARREGDPAKREVLYDKAVEAYQTFIEGNPFSELLPKAESSYVDLCNSYGRALESSLDEAVDEEAEALRVKIKAVLEDGLERTGELIDTLSKGDIAPGQVSELNRLLLNRGQMLITLAKVSLDGTFFFSQAEKTLEDLALRAGETSGWGLNAYILLSQAKIAAGEFEDAAAFAEFVVDTAIPVDPEVRQNQGWDEMTAEDKARRWEMAERATLPLLDSYVNAGDTETAAIWALHFYNTWKAEGFTLKPVGSLSLLGVARTLLAAGGAVGGSIGGGSLQWFDSEESMAAAGFTSRRNARSSIDLALDVAQSVNNDNKGNTLQLRAQKVIAEIRNVPGVVLSPKILLEAAQGEYYAKNYAQARTAFNEVMASLDAQDEATKQEYAPQILYFLGRTLERLERPLEAAMAHREAVTQWAGDPEFQPKNAKSFYDVMGSLKRRSPGDKLLESVWLDAERIYQESAANATDIAWRQGERAYDKQDYTAARSKFLEVAENEDSYEKALVKAALCLYKQGDSAATEAELTSYLEGYVPDPAHTLTTGNKLNAREAARAQAVFYLGRIAYSAQDYERALGFLATFFEAFPDQTSYAPNALYMALMSHLGQGQAEEAKTVHAVMREHFAGHTRTGSGADKIYNVLNQERDAAVAAEKSDVARSLTEQMADFKRIYNTLASAPSFGSLRQESKLWIEVEGWAEAEAVLRRILQSYGEAPDQAENITKYIRPDLGWCLVEQRRVQEAFEVLDPLIPAPDDKEDARKPSKRTISSWCRSITGWAEGDATSIVEVPGVGDADAALFEKALVHRNKLVEREKFNGAGDWECPWYHIKFELAYGYLQWGRLDSVRTATARKIIQDMHELLGDASMADVADKCGDDLLQKRFAWLWGKVQ